MLQRTITRLSRLLLQTIQLDDPWHRYEHAVPLERFGRGARHDFPWYFEGRSSVQVGSVEELTAWLSRCEYVRDPELFNEADYWQHPRTFEHLRKGDCEDFSLWAWRKLVELGYDAEFVAGQCLSPACGGSPHTWVLLHAEDTSFVLDPVIRDASLILQPLHVVREAYTPEFAVDRFFRRYAFAGYYRALLAEAP